MKKSEAINQLQSFIGGYYDEYFINRDDVEVFLDYCTETIKMLPPSTCETGNCKENGCGHFWEEESE